MPTNTLATASPSATVETDSIHTPEVTIETNTSVATIPDKKLTREERKEIGMEKAGLTDDRLFKTAVEGLNAMKVIPETQWHTEQVIPDHDTRHKFLDTLLRVKGYIRPDASIENTVNFNLSVTERSAIRGRLVRGMGLGKVIDV